MPPQIRSIAGQLYDGVLSPDDWYGGMEAFNQAVGGFKFHQLTVDHRLGAVMDSVASDVQEDAAAVQTYEQHYAMRDERLAVVLRLRQGQSMLDHEHFSCREMSRSPIYSEWLASLGMKHTMVLMQRVEGQVQEYVGFMRQLDQRPFGDTDRRLAQQLMPDLLRATRLRAQARSLARQASLGLAALGALPQGIAVVDAQCRLHHANAAANGFFTQLGPITFRHGRMHWRDGASDARWQALVAAACAGAASSAGAIRLEHGPMRLVATVLPLKADHAIALRQAPMALVILVDPGVPRGLTSDLLTEMLGLSPTEARLALILASGKTVKDFAILQGCTWNTARGHLAHLLRKAGCRRQTELVGLLQSLRLG